MIDERDIEELKARADIVAVARARGVEVREQGGTALACCPFHAEKTPSFKLNRERNTYHCFGCGEGGGVVDLVMKLDGLEFIDALRRLAGETGMTLRETEDRRTPEEQAAARQRKAESQTKQAWLLRLLARAQERFEAALWADSDESKAAREYILARGFTEETLRAFGAGYAVAGRDSLRHWVRGLLAGQEAALERCAIAAGLLGQSDGGFVYARFRARITFPIHDEQGRVLGFTARILPAHDNGKTGKYVNSPETEVFKKGECLFGLGAALPAIRRSREAVLCEGAMDVLALHQAGVTHAVAPLGTSFTEAQAGLLARYCRSLVAWFDDDEAGWNATEKAARICAASGLRMKTIAAAGTA